MVEAQIACSDASAGSQMSLHTPAGDLAFKVPPTGGWHQYRTLELGRVTLTQGSHSLVLAASTKPGEAVVNLRSITLRRK